MAISDSGSGLNKLASFVISSSKSSTYRLRLSEVRNAVEIFPLAKIYCTGEQPQEVRSVPPPVAVRQPPCWNECLSILRGRFLLFQLRGTGTSGGFQIAFRCQLVQLDEAIRREHVVQ